LFHKGMADTSNLEFVCSNQRGNSEVASVKRLSNLVHLGMASRHLFPLMNSGRSGMEPLKLDLNIHGS
jgi:hypothetical protein